MDVINKINGFVGVDWSLNKISIDGETISIDLLEEKGYKVTISCINFIGFSFIGNWDEAIIESIRIEADGDLIDSSLREIKRLYGETIYMDHPAIKKIGNEWYQLNIKLIDGNVIKMACESFKADM